MFGTGPGMTEPIARRHSGLDPAIHRLRKKSFMRRMMDPRVKPAGDAHAWRRECPPNAVHRRPAALASPRHATSARVISLRGRHGMRRIVFVLLTVLPLAGGIAYMGDASGQAGDEAAPIFGIKMPPGYRDWRVISVAHEEGSLNDLRAVLGNDVAFKAARDGTLPYPDGAIVARIAWSYE